MTEKPTQDSPERPDWLRKMLDPNTEFPTQEDLDESYGVFSEPNNIDDLVLCFEKFVNHLATHLAGRYNCSYKIKGLDEAGGVNSEMIITLSGPAIKIMKDSSQASEKGKGVYFNWSRSDHIKPTIRIYSQRLRRDYGTMPNRKPFQAMLNCDKYLDNIPVFLQALEDHGLESSASSKKYLPKPKES